MKNLVMSHIPNFWSIYEARFNDPDLPVLNYFYGFTTFLYFHDHDRECIEKWKRP